MIIVSEGDYSANESDTFGTEIQRTLMQLASQLETMEAGVKVDSKLKEFAGQGYLIPLFDRLAQLRGYIAQQQAADTE